MTLYVGCDPSWTTITQPANFVTTFPLYVSDTAPINIYNFDPFVSSLSYCDVTSVTLGTVTPAGAVRLAQVATENCDTNNVDCRKVVVDT